MVHYAIFLIPFQGALTGKTAGAENSVTKRARASMPGTALSC